ncbi:Pleiotropic drug resistance protein 3 isoform G [Glycine soja]|uniref:Pleiotropic drug resistance protein 3 isoform G n=1 Tax=Glycine soja TaxID=3848 RepID=A0A445G170_GLYSO|nr:Pleiotropic drug resistance protein 3 isoform G [Glycine soja]
MPLVSREFQASILCNKKLITTPEKRYNGLKFRGYPPLRELLQLCLMFMMAWKQVVDVRKLGAQERHTFIEKLIKHIENDNLRLLQKFRKRIDKVGINLPTVELRYQNLSVEAECKIVQGKPIPTLWNTLKEWIFDTTKLSVLKSQNSKISIIKNDNGIIKPGRYEGILGVGVGDWRDNIRPRPHPAPLPCPSRGKDTIRH